MQLELLRMLDGGNTGLAAGYAAASIVAGFAAVTLATNLVAGRSREPRRVIAGSGCSAVWGPTGRFLLDGAVSGARRAQLPVGHAGGEPQRRVRARRAGRRDALRRRLPLAGVGLLGAYTTFSTWMLESHRLAEDGRAAPRHREPGRSLVAGVAAAWLGQQVGGAL